MFAEYSSVWEAAVRETTIRHTLEAWRYYEDRKDSKLFDYDTPSSMIRTDSKLDETCVVSSVYMELLPVTTLTLTS